METNKFPISIHKNCEIISIQPDAEKECYTVQAKFTTPTSECVASTLHLKGSAENIGRIMECLSKEFAAGKLQEKELESPRLDRVVFEIRGKKVIGKDQDNKEIILSTEVPEHLDPAKIKEISSHFFQPAAAPAAKVIDSIPKIKIVWKEINANLKMRKEDKIKQKISDLHAFVRHLAKQRGLDPDRIDEAVDILSESHKSLTEVLSCYRLQYFPELDAELKELQECEECIKHIHFTPN